MFIALSDDVEKMAFLGLLFMAMGYALKGSKEKGYFTYTFTLGVMLFVLPFVGLIQANQYEKVVIKAFHMGSPIVCQVEQKRDSVLQFLEKSKGWSFHNEYFQNEENALPVKRCGIKADATFQQKIDGQGWLFVLALFGGALLLNLMLRIIFDWEAFKKTFT